ncbi:MAG: hypothetical protein JW862_19735, partial [Anaerolineales bacterium]|nr:hypothetical protein [Anaerolineales bacterium]
MRTEWTLSLTNPAATLERAGGKGASLARLVQAGFPVPDGFCISTNAYRCFVADNRLQPHILATFETIDPNDPASLETASRTIWGLFNAASLPAEIANAVVQAYLELPGDSPAVAVRSSATAEDLPQASFAGQQETWLNIRSSGAVLAATRQCWASLWTARAIGYRIRQGIDPQQVALAVVVQLLVPAEAAGILFTANPLDGNRAQVLINAAWGLGEAVVSGLVTPDTLTLEKATGKVLERTTSQKLVQTIRDETGTLAAPVPQALQRAAVLNDSQAAELARLGTRIEQLFGLPVDVEWALSEQRFAILQARPITALPQPARPAPTEWKLPSGAYAAMRNNIVEMMIDPLSPLFKTLGLRAVNDSWNRLLFRFFQREGIMPADPIIAVNEYAYYNGSIKFLPMLKMMLGVPGIIRRMFNGAVERWTETGRPQYLARVASWETQNWRALPAVELLQAVQELTGAAVGAYGALVSGVIPAAWMSEAWFTLQYRFTGRKGDPSAATFLLGFDSLPIRAEQALYDLAQWAGSQPGLAASLQRIPAGQLAEQIQQARPPAAVAASTWQAWQAGFQAHLQQYGHMIYNLDFANPVPADDPWPVLETFQLFLRGEGRNPYHRQQEAITRRTQATEAIEARLKGRRLRVFRKNLARAQKYAPLREDGLADVGLSYPLVRQMLRELGQRLVGAGAIREADEIYWLEQAEVEAAAASLDQGQPLVNLQERIPERKAAWQAARKASPPLALPQIKVFGFDLMQLKSGGLRKPKGNLLKGVAASPGSVRATARVIHGPEDFSKMQTGDVLVAPLTTPAWTPLFARAAAVVTDVGGPLSHGSIVAREYGIPAVL